jgi:sucrose-6-phosphate hydrolase SacC (GH32 family)
MVHPMAVPITDPKEGSVCTGSWIRHGEKEYLFYTIRMGNRQPAPIKRSISTDGYHFEKDEGFGFSLVAPYSADCARDPKVIRDADGVFHMFLTTALVKEEKGCLAHFISSDLENWRDTGAPIYVASDSTQPECPDYFEYGGKYYLIFSLHGKAHYMISEKPFEDFYELEDSIIPCESVPKGAIWGDHIIFTGFRGMGGYAGAMTFRYARALPNGELQFDKLG